MPFQRLLKYLQADFYANTLHNKRQEVLPTVRSMLGKVSLYTGKVFVSDQTQAPFIII